TELNGYDDKNYKIVEDPNVKNPLITSHSEHGYVLKIMNSIDSQDVGVVEAQNEIMNFLDTSNITCSQTDPQRVRAPPLHRDDRRQASRREAAGVRARRPAEGSAPL
ncbi:hypothetical protein EGM85_11695, partial [Macrococcus caseolyticus]